MTLSIRERYNILMGRTPSGTKLNILNSSSVKRLGFVQRIKNAIEFSPTKR